MTVCSLMYNHIPLHVVTCNIGANMNVIILSPNALDCHKPDVRMETSVLSRLETLHKITGVRNTPECEMRLLCRDAGKHHVI